MAISVVQVCSGVNYNVSSANQTFGSPNTAGNTLVACFMCQTANPTVSDTLSNVWSAATVFSQAMFSGTFTLKTYVLFNCKAGSNTVTVGNLGAGSFSSLFEISGVSAVDQSNSNSGNASGTTFTSAAITTLFANEIIIVHFGSGSAPSTAKPLVQAPLTVAASPQATATYNVAGYDVVSSTQAGFTGAATMNSGDVGCGSIILSLYNAPLSSSKAPWMRAFTGFINKRGLV